MFNELVQDDRAQARTAIALVITVAVAAIIASVLLPVAIDAIEDPNEDTLNQTVGESYQVNGELESTVTAVTAGSDATVELNDTRTASTTSNTINVGSNATYQLDGGDVTVGVDESGSNYAVVTYTYDKDYAYSDGASSLWGILGLAAVLAILLFMINVARSSSSF